MPSGSGALLSSALLLTLLIFVPGGQGIRITEVKVPEWVEAGQGAELDCQWAADGDQMYSIKWYQGPNEFYRYTPTGGSPVQVFDPPTLDVDKDKSWYGNVRIDNITLAADGPFHCEVSADGPTFHTASDTATIRVVGLPKGGPILKGIRTRYNVGEWVDLTCSTRNAKPAPTLTFILNDMPAPLGWVDQQANVTDGDGLTTSTLRLRFRLTGHVVARGGMAGVSCHALIPGVYARNASGIITTTAPHHASVRGTAVAPHQGYRQDLLSVALPLLPTFLLPALTHA